MRIADRIAAPLLSLALGSLFTLSQPACSSGARVGESPLPQELHGLPLSEAKSGDDAAGAIEQLHGRQIAPQASWVGTYGTGAMQATLYVSRYESEEAARAQLDSMATHIDAGGTGFGHHTGFVVNGRGVQSVFGKNQIHYFFVEGTDLKWLAMAPMMARAGAAQLLGVPVDSIPPLGGAPRPAAAPADSGAR